MIDRLHLIVANQCEKAHIQESSLKMVGYAALARITSIALLAFQAIAIIFSPTVFTAKCIVYTVRNCTKFNFRTNLNRYLNAQIIDFKANVMGSAMSLSSIFTAELIYHKWKVQKGLFAYSNQYRIGCSEIPEKAMALWIRTASYLSSSPINDGDLEKKRQADFEKLFYDEWTKKALKSNEDSLLGSPFAEKYFRKSFNESLVLYIEQYLEELPDDEREELQEMHRNLLKIYEDDLDNLTPVAKAFYPILKRVVVPKSNPSITVEPPRPPTQNQPAPIDEEKKKAEIEAAKKKKEAEKAAKEQEEKDRKIAEELEKQFKQQDEKQAQALVHLPARISNLQHVQPLNLGQNPIIPAGQSPQQPRHTPPPLQQSRIDHMSAVLAMLQSNLDELAQAQDQRHQPPNFQSMFQILHQTSFAPLRLMSFDDENEKEFSEAANVSLHQPQPGQQLSEGENQFAKTLIENFEKANNELRAKKFFESFCAMEDETTAIKKLGIFLHFSNSGEFWTPGDRAFPAWIPKIPDKATREAVKKKHLLARQQFREKMLTFQKRIKDNIEMIKTHLEKEQKLFRHLLLRMCDVDVTAEMRKQVEKDVKADPKKYIEKFGEKPEKAKIDEELGIRIDAKIDQMRKDYKEDMENPINAAIEPAMTQIKNDITELAETLQSELLNHLPSQAFSKAYF